MKITIEFETIDQDEALRIIRALFPSAVSYKRHCEECSRLLENGRYRYCRACVRGKQHLQSRESRARQTAELRAWARQA